MAGLEATPAIVSQTTRRVTTSLVSIRTDSETLVTTPDHPFATLGKGWTPAGRLAIGDLIVDRSLRGARVLGVDARTVPPTEVYNLTVPKSHSYRVGKQGLLVHNVNCFNFSKERDDPSPSKRLTEEEKEGIRRRLAEQRRQRQIALGKKRRTFNDSDTTTKYCAYCALGGLSDLDKLSSLLKDYQFTLPNPNVNQIGRLMDQLGLRDDTTPPEALFRPKKGDNVGDFIRNSSANTFLVNMFVVDLKNMTAIAHALVAVRREDGSVTYLDLQKKPPETYHGLDPRADRVIVQPTNVDWRFNRTLFDAIQNTPPTNVP
jgi:hypothetical protein